MVTISSLGDAAMVLNAAPIARGVCVKLSKIRHKKAFLAILTGTATRI
jgi:hypothetical protein